MAARPSTRRARSNTIRSSNSWSIGVRGPAAAAPRLRRGGRTRADRRISLVEEVSPVRTTLVCGVLLALSMGVTFAQQPAAAPLNYEYFKVKVEPILLAKRPGHARCVACHGSGTPLRLQPLSPGATAWTEDESRKNFDVIRRVAQPGNL